MCEIFNPCKYITNECIDYKIIIDFVYITNKLSILPKYAKTIITQSKGCVKCFFSRLTKHICNELGIGEYMELYKKMFAKAVLNLYKQYFEYLLKIGIISKNEFELNYEKFIITYYNS